MPKKKPTPPVVVPGVTVVLKKIEWLGHLKKMVELPDKVKLAGGNALHFVQVGQDPPDWGEMDRIGSGAKEIRLQDENGWYRIFYVAKLSEAIFILGIVKKKTNATSQADIDNAKIQYKLAENENAALKAQRLAQTKPQPTKAKEEKK
jgi:phage-related protein